MGEVTAARRSLLAVALAAALLGSAAAAEPEPRPRRVLSVHGYEPGRPVDAIFTSSLRAALPLGSDLALYSEYLDRLRFPDPGYVEEFRAWLRAKYARTPPEVIVAVGVDALEFLADPATTPFPGVPVVFGIVEDHAAARLRLPPTFTGLTVHLAIPETLALARALFPETRRVALVGGASAQDAPFKDLLRREVSSAAPDLEVIELFGLPLADTQDRLRRLPPRTVVITAALFQDGAGRLWSGTESVPAMAAASSAPLFVAYEHLLGLGATGGVVTDIAEAGREAARVAQRVLAGERPDDIPVRPSASNRPVLDARQLERFGVPARLVPPGAEVRFREPSAWERSRAAIVGVALALAVQSALIALLLLERRRRWRAEAKAREALGVMAHMNRVAALGELVGSLAHEINSPLGAVLNNAEAAQRFLAHRDDVQDVEGEVRSCLADIAKDATRAGEVIRRIRGALRREAWTPVKLDVAALIRDALHLVHAETRDRGVAVDVQIAPDLPAVTGDEVQLVQVILNLLVNAIDAVSGLPEGQRRVSIAAEPAGDRLAIRVADSGPGVPPDVAARLFEPFFTTKPRGLGMGLSISRSIVEAHRGTIAVHPGAGGGAIFEVLLPANDVRAEHPVARAAR